MELLIPFMKDDHGEFTIEKIPRIKSISVNFGGAGAGGLCTTYILANGSSKVICSNERGVKIQDIAVFADDEYICYFILSLAYD